MNEIESMIISTWRWPRKRNNR